jgi:hypothetical protein
MMSLALVMGLGWATAYGAQERNDDRLEENVPGHKDWVKVTHIFRHYKAKPAAAACICGGPESSAYSLEKAKWFDPAINYTIYTLNSGLGAAAGDAIKASFTAWKTNEPAAPSPVAVQNDTAAGPGIALDNEQNVSWQPLSATYGANTLAVTVYWYSRTKTGGYSKIMHFDMAYNKDFPWAMTAGAGACGGGEATQYDVQAIGTHEAGHVYGLNHNNGCNLTMNPTAAAGETTKSTLAVGDINGIQAIY